MAPETTLAAAGLSVCHQPMLPRPFRVVRYRRELKDTFTLFLEPEDGSGSFIFGPVSSICSTIPVPGKCPSPSAATRSKPRQLVHTIRAVGNVTRLLQKYRPGDTLGVRGPSARPGRWIRPWIWTWSSWPAAWDWLRLRPVIYHVLAHRQEYGNVELIYGARSPQEMLFRRELERWRGRFDLRVHATVDSAGPDWRGNVGVVTNLISHARFDPHQTMALVCGPGVMMRFTIQELHRLGLQPQDIFVSLERNMQCGLGLCGHCQLGPFFVCKDGPVFSYDRVGKWFERREI